MTNLLLAIRALLLALLCFPLLGFPAVARAQPAAPQVMADGVCIIDGASGAIVYSKNPDKRYPMASTTKTMTAVLALEMTDIKRRVVVDVSWDEIPDSSIMGLDLMEEVTIEDLLYGLMLPSGNDAARAIARSIAGDDYRFAQLMNSKAQELGLVNTHYVNPHGRNQEDHYTSACDLAKLGQYAMQNPVFRQIVGTKQATVLGRYGTYPLRNVNRFLLDYPGADGVKTGFDDERIPTTGLAAGSAVVASAVRDGHRGYVAVLHTWANYATEAAELMDYFFNNHAALAP